MSTTDEKFKNIDFSEDGYMLRFSPDIEENKLSIEGQAIESVLSRIAIQVAHSLLDKYNFKIQIGDTSIEVKHNA